MSERMLVTYRSKFGATVKVAGVRGAPLPIAALDQTPRARAKSGRRSREC
jgi:hypothetical protein